MAKLGDTVSVTGARAPTECKKCGEESGKCIMSHIILRCPVTRKIADQNGVGEGKGVTAEGRMRQILNDDRMQEAIGAIVEAWMEKKVEQGKEIGKKKG